MLTRSLARSLACSLDGDMSAAALACNSIREDGRMDGVGSAECQSVKRRISGKNVLSTISASDKEAEVPVIQNKKKQSRKYAR